jgi:dipeptidyl aminopeptidase B
MSTNPRKEEEQSLLAGVESQVEKHEENGRSFLDERRRDSLGSVSTASTTSLVLENLNEYGEKRKKHTGENRRSSKAASRRPAADDDQEAYRDDESDTEVPRFRSRDGTQRDMSSALRRAIWIVAVIAAAGWGLAIVLFLASGRHKPGTYQYDDENPRVGSGRKITMGQIHRGEWRMRTAPITWIASPDGRDGLVLEENARGKDYLVVEDIRSRRKEEEGQEGEIDVFQAKTLMKSRSFTIDGASYFAQKVQVSPDLKKVLVLVNTEKVFRHSYTALYFILDVESKTWEALDHDNPTARVQLAQWSPGSDAIVFTRDNNLFLRMMNSGAVRQITDDGGADYFYGIPDWVYEEEVFGDRVATWWSRDGNYVAFLRTNETAVPSYPLEYFIQRPSGKIPDHGLESYPETKQIKYPRAGSPNPVVDMLFYDVQRNEHFEVEVQGGFKDENRLITNVLWADGAKALVQEANRESDRIRYVLVDVEKRSGKTVRDVNLKEKDLGWVEPAQRATYVPADPENGRPQDGYIDTVLSEGNDHLAYYTPIDSGDPIMLTSGDWEVDAGPTAVDLKNNLVYFVSTAVAITQRHVLSVSLTDPKGSITPVTSINTPGYWSASFSSGASYASLLYEGPSIPYQKVQSVGPNSGQFAAILEDNNQLAQMASTHEMPHLVYRNVTINGFTMQILERRPPHFDPKHQYPVIFYQYSGPGSQSVARRFSVDFQSYLAAAQNYIVVTVDGRGTGFSGLEHRKVIREHFGTVEPEDQIAVAKLYAKKRYVDAERMAIWGWSYGGYTTLKTLEMDAGQTFHYGMAVAPVTDWRFYDSIYTERYMLTPEANPTGYKEAAVHNVSAIAGNVRWLIMHGTGDDNVHVQNTLTLLDEFDLKGIGNYDVHFWPDSDHSIYFHGANPLVYERLDDWIAKAFAGDYYPKPDGLVEGDGTR